MKTCFYALILAGILVAGTAQAQKVSKDEALTAPIYFEPGNSAGRSMQTLIGCLENWKEGPEDKRSRTEVTVKAEGRDGWQVAAMLRSPAVFHFIASREGGSPVLILNRVEYRIEQRGYQQLTDLQTKKVVLEAVCR